MTAFGLLNFVIGFGAGAGAVLLALAYVAFRAAFTSVSTPGPRGAQGDPATPPISPGAQQGHESRATVSLLDPREVLLAQLRSLDLCLWQALGKLPLPVETQ